MYQHTTSSQLYTAELRRVEILSAAEERKLVERWSHGDERVVGQLVRANLPFVIRIAREYRRWGVPMEDLIQQGNLGLLKAAIRFDPSKECRLITYAAYWIRAEIRDYVVRAYRIVRLGSTRTERNAMRAYRTESITSAEALAERSGMPLARAAKLWPLLGASDVSMDAQYGESGAADWIASSHSTPEQDVAEGEASSLFREALAIALDDLSDRERSIVRDRLLAEEPRTLEELGRELGVSKERVRQLEARAHGKLRERLVHLRPAA